MAASVVVTRWAVGNPERLAEDFFAASEERGKSLGSRLYLQFIAAIASANVHNILAQTTVIDQLVKDQIRNVILTAKATEQLVAAKLPLEDRHADTSSDDDDTGENQSMKSAERPLKKLELVAHDITEADRSRRSTGSYDDLFTGSRLPLPEGIIQSIMSLLDSESAAAAALTCKQLSSAHRLNRFFELSAPFRAYLQTLVDMQDDFSDGSIESEFYLHFPIDGSPACGQDLAAESYSRRMLAAMPLMTKLFALLGGGPGTRSLSEFKSSIKGNTQEKPPAPHSFSTPLAFFKKANPVPIMASTPLSSPNLATVPFGTPDAAASTGTGTSGAASAAYSSAAAHTPSTGTATSGPSTSDAAFASPAPACCLANAICDVQELGGVPAGHMHCDGDLVVIAYACGLKQRDPGLSAMVASRSYDPSYQDVTTYGDAGLFSFATRVCADSANGLVWAGADKGRRVKAFRAPTKPTTTVAGCNRPDGSNEMELQYTLCTDVSGRPSFHAGVHVVGTSVMCVQGSGTLLVWDIAGLPAQKACRAAKNLPGYTDDEDEEVDSDDDGSAGMDDEYGGGGIRGGNRSHGRVRRSGGGSSAGSQPFQDHMGLRDTEDSEELEVSRGVLPHVVSQLPTPSRRGQPSAASLLTALGGQARYHNLHSTCLLAEESAPVAPTLIAALTGSIVASYDLETLRLRHCFLGHLYDVTQIAAPPASWQQPNLFATSSRAGDVKLWDLRMRGGSAAITLTTGDTDPLHTVVLARAGAAGGGGPYGSGGGWTNSGGPLGAGMLCFAGGEGQAVWAWDLRGGMARPLYELSTGNTSVQSLVWHEAGSSLLAACECHLEDRLGGFHRHDWRLVPVGEDDAESADAGPADSDSDPEADGAGDGGSSRSDEDEWEGEGAGSSHSDEDEGTSLDDVGDGDTAGAPNDGGMEESAGYSGRRRAASGASGAERRDGAAPRSRPEASAPASSQPQPPRAHAPRRYWPVRAKHQPTDFSRFFNMASSCVLRYRFSEQAHRAVPRSEPPSFDCF